jgi:hypothetical protein
MTQRPQVEQHHVLYPEPTTQRRDYNSERTNTEEQAV